MKKSGIIWGGKYMYKYEAKVYGEPSEYGINGGRISKLDIRRRDDNGLEQVVYRYDRGLDIQADDVATELILERILGELN